MFTVHVKYFQNDNLLAAVDRHYYERFDARTVAEVEFKQTCRGGNGAFGPVPAAEEKFVEAFQYTAYWNNRSDKVVVFIRNSEGNQCTLRNLEGEI